MLIWAKNSLCEVKFQLLGHETGEVSNKFGGDLVRAIQKGFLQFYFSFLILFWNVVCDNYM